MDVARQHHQVRVNPGQVEGSEFHVKIAEP